MKLKRPPIFIIILYGAILVTGLLLFQRSLVKDNFADLVKTAELGQFIGPENSDKVIVEFLDYRCSACRSFHPMMKDYLEKNPDVKVVFRHYPVFGDVSIYDAELALSAAIHGQFEAMHNHLITREDPITEPELRALALTLGIDFETLDKDRRHPAVGPVLLRNFDAVEALGVKSVPTFLVNGELISINNIPSTDRFHEIMDEALR